MPFKNYCFSPVIYTLRGISMSTKETNKIKIITNNNIIENLLTNLNT